MDAERVRRVHRVRIAGLHPLSKDAQKLRRFFSANSLDTELDAAGRVMVPTFLLDHAGLGKDVVVTGADDSLEIWDRADLDDVQRRTRPPMSTRSPHHLGNTA